MSSSGVARAEFEALSGFEEYDVSLVKLEEWCV
jgi:hypothetical protein